MPKTAKSGCVRKLLQTLYGTRDTANAWDYNAAIDQVHDTGLSSPCLYYHREEDSHRWRHGDDLVFDGEDNWLDELQNALERKQAMTNM